MGLAHPRFAVLMDFAFSSFQEEPRRGMMRYAEEAGVDLVFFGLGRLNPDDGLDRFKLFFLDFITPDEFDGVVIVSSTFQNFGGSNVLADHLRSLSPLPIVSIGPSLIGEDSIVYDNRAGMRALTRHLTDAHGYRRFAYVSGPQSNPESRERREAFLDALRDAGIALDSVREFEGSFLPHSGAAAVEAFLGAPGPRPEVIVCANDLMALGAWTALADRSIAVPFDIAVTGYDDSQVAGSISHQFTTVRQSFDELGYLAVRRVHALARGETLGPFVPIEPTLRIRSSCGCVSFPERYTSSPKMDGSPEFESLRSAIAAFVAEGRPLSEARELFRDWSMAIRQTLASHRPLCQFEDMLHAVGAGVLAANLYALLLEERTQAGFESFWGESLFTNFLEITTDHAQHDIGLDLALEKHADAIKRVMDQCRASELHIVRFADLSDPKKGLNAIFSFGSTGPWIPAPGSWLPPRGHSLVANLIAVDDEQYGYFLIDAAVPVASTFDYLRIRFSFVARELATMKSVRDLNESLVREVAAREESESRLKEALALVEQLSLEDELTGLRNRRGFLAMADHQAKYLKRSKRGFFVLYADLDGLKEINDTWGHDDGDLAIKAAADVFRSALRETDIVARMGGDEFTALVNEADPPNYEMIKERIEAYCERKSAELGRPWRLAMSIGHYYAPPGCELDIQQMLKEADAELYSEKQQRRGRSRR
ncbi:MAG TPA: GGDEF domain-containing protein [Treponemataceae bacterium]|nr:GGDEF domain-containing protein [Treponemataceae bacterium]